MDVMMSKSSPDCEPADAMSERDADAAGDAGASAPNRFYSAVLYVNLRGCSEFPSVCFSSPDLLITDLLAAGCPSRRPCLCPNLSAP
jgi:hypothetical protein